MNGGRRSVLGGSNGGGGPWGGKMSAMGGSNSHGGTPSAGGNVGGGTRYGPFGGGPTGAQSPELSFGGPVSGSVDLDTGGEP